ncbi:MAG: hypothetical protein MH213_08895 [Marinobacter sp.]|nr:hypothetical protein [Marinobacter sp.]
MNDESTTVAAPQSLEQLLKTSPELQDQATLDGLSDLITKAAPIIQGRRLHNIIDLLAATSDVIEMADDNMVQKLMALYEEGIGGAWAISNALRYAAVQAAHDEIPADNLAKPAAVKQRRRRPPRLKYGYKPGC